MRSRATVVAAITVLFAGLFGLQAAASADTFSDSGFAAETIATVPPYTLVGMAFAPDGRLFVWQKNGVVRVIEDGQMLATPFIDLSDRVNTSDDRGFWGLAFDPNFATNRHVYLSYTYEDDNDPNSNGARTSRLTRVTASAANPDVAVPGSETVILGSVGTPPCSAYPVSSDCIGADSGSHTIGSLHFASDGKLFVGVGDGATASFADPLSLRAQDLDSPNGKILRINTDGSAPGDNPFYDGTDSWRSRVWMYGVRNPFGFTIHPDTGELFFGDVGWNTWEEVNHGFQGANFGWPCYEGNGPEGAYRSLYAQCGLLDAGAVQSPFYTYDHGSGSAVIGGPIYTGTLYPPAYRDNFFFSDYSGNFIKRVVLDDEHRPVSTQPFAADVAAPVSLVQGPDGMVYYLSFTTGEVRRIRFNGVTASASATPRSGHSPLSVSFSSAGTTNAGGGPLSYDWDFGDGESSTEANPTHTYTTATVKTYDVKLTVSNGLADPSTATVPVTVGSVPPTPIISAPAEGLSVKPGQSVHYAGSASDADDGDLPASALTWTVLVHHNTHIHTFLGGTGTEGSFVAENHGPIGSFHYEIILTATDSSGLQGKTSMNVAVSSDTSSPTAPATLAATASGSSEVNLSWPAAADDVAVTGYRVERCEGDGCTEFAEIATSTDTSFSDFGVVGSTTYRYRVRAVDPSGNRGAYSDVAEAMTDPAPIRPAGLVGAWAFNEGTGSTVADVSGNRNTGTIAGTTWTTQGRYGGALGFNGSSTVRIPPSSSLDLSSGMTLSAWIRPTAPQSGWRTIVQRETDAYFLNASNDAGSLQPAGGGTLASSGTVYTAGPTASPLNTWTNVALTYDGTALRLYVNGTQVASRPGSGAIDTTSHPLWIGGNSPYGEYFTGLIDEVRVYDRALSESEIQIDMNTSLAATAPDSTPPSTPAGLTATPASASRVNLGWSDSTDDQGVSGYRVERCLGAGCTDFVEVATATGTSLADTGVGPSATYRYRVRAEDLSGNLSDYSAIASATTPAPPDTTAPTAPSGLTATANGIDRIDLAWTAATDDVAVTAYRIERCTGASCTSFTQIGTATGTSFSNAGLAPSTSYRYRVRAADAAGNLSGYSSVATATTEGVPDTTPPGAPSGLTTTAASREQVNLAWTEATDNVGVEGYRVERCLGAGCTDFAEVAAPAGESYQDTGLSSSTTYRYRVRALDAAGNLGAYTSVEEATTDAAPPSPSGLVGAWAFGEGVGLTTSDSSGNENTGTINGATWTTQGRYGGALMFNGANTVRIPSSTSLTLTTGMTMSAWIQPTAAQGGWRTIIQREVDAYFLNASSDAGPLRPAGGGTFDGITDYTAGPIANPLDTWTYVALTYDGSVLRLYVNGTQVASRAATGAIATSANPLWIGGNSPYGEYFTGLIDEARLYDRALSQTEIEADMNAPIVPTAPDSTPPAAPAGLTATPAGATQVNVSWTAATDNVGVSGYRLERCQGAGCTSFVEVATPTATTRGDAGLAPSTMYRYRVRAADLAGNLSDYSSVVTVTTPAPPDTTAPSAPSALTATADGIDGIDLTWDASTDDSGVAEYRIERCSGTGCTSFVQVATTSATSYSSTGLTAGTDYRFRVRAADVAGNLSAYSTVAADRTNAGDTTAPTAPAGLAATAASPAQIDLTWTAASDDVGVTGYRVERCQGASCTDFADIATTTTTSYSDTGRVAATAYRYRVRANDAAGNLGPYTSIAAATTAGDPDTTPPSAPGELTATAAGSEQVNLAWPAATDDVAVAGYRVERCAGSGCTDFAQIGAPTGTSYADTGVVASTTYRYRVRASDTSGNPGGYSGIADATTPAAPTTPVGLVGAWAFEEGSGSITADVSGNGNTGTINGASWTSGGRNGNALSFDGAGATVEVAPSSSLELTTEMTLSAWIKPTASQSGWRTIVQRQVDAYFLNASNDTGPLRPSGGGTFGGATDFVSGATPNPLGVWTNVALTYDGSILRLYVNGAQVATKAMTGPIATGSSPLWIGGNQPYGEFFNGLLDDIRVYNRALTQAEIQTDMSTPLTWSGLSGRLL
jgi:glucose/arabinose dehydrogenase/fibronectin type 3 domain-containing protein